MKSNVHPAAKAGPAAPQRFNALRHGRRSNAVLLPGDDVADFRRLRHEFFHLHKPRTLDEALCVENIVSCHWRILRAKAEQLAFKDHLGLSVGADPEGAGSLCNADPHTLHHRAADCGIEETRLSRIKHKEYSQLTAFQKQRAHHLNAGAEEALQDYRVFMAQGEPVVEAADAGAQEVAAAALPAGSSASPVSRTGENFEQPRATRRAVRGKPWRGRQRAAAARREGVG